MAKQRARTARIGNTGATRQYTPDKTVKYETLIQEIFAHEYPRFSPMIGELEAVIEAYFTIPKSASKKKADLMRRGLIRPTKKPDWDNIGKIVTDAFNTTAYHDDSAIVDAIVRKFYSDIPCLIIHLSEMNLLGKEEE